MQPSLHLSAKFTISHFRLYLHRAVSEMSHIPVPFYKVLFYVMILDQLPPLAVPYEGVLYKTYCVYVQHKPCTRLGHTLTPSPFPLVLPDGYSHIFRSYVFGPSGIWTMAPLRYAAKFDPFLSLDCVPRPPPWRNPRKGRDRILPFGNLGRRARASSSTA